MGKYTPKRSQKADTTHKPIGNNMQHANRMSCTLGLCYGHPIFSLCILHAIILNTTFRNCESGVDKTGISL